MLKKSQGEIFGIALMFVVIIVGILIYGQVKSVIDVGEENDEKKYRYEVLADGMMNTMLKMSTGCNAFRNQDKIEDLIFYCEYRWDYSEPDPEITCKNGDIENSCSLIIDTLNATLLNLLNESNIGPIPYKLVVSAPNDESSLNLNMSNFGSYKYRGIVITEDNYLKNGFKRVSSGPRKVQTSRRNVDFELFLYYR